MFMSSAPFVGEFVNPVETQWQLIPCGGSNVSLIVFSPAISVERATKLDELATCSAPGDCCVR